MTRSGPRYRVSPARPLLVGTIVWLALGQAARATDEIQVYNASIAAPGQFTVQQHLNYVGIGQKEPPFPGGFASDKSLNGTPELAYGMTDWWELGLYQPFAVKDRQFLSDAFKLRTLFVSPHADQRNFFYGVNFEFSYQMPKFSQTRFGLEIRPLIGVRNDAHQRQRAGQPDDTQFRLLYLCAHAATLIKRA